MSGLLSFSDYRNRIRAVNPAKSAEKVLWNSLCRYGLSAMGHPVDVEYETLQLPKAMLLRLTPKRLAETSVILPGLLELYEVLHKNLRREERQALRARVAKKCACSGD